MAGLWDGQEVAAGAFCVLQFGLWGQFISRACLLVDGSPKTHNEFYKAIKTDIWGHCQVEDIYDIAEHMKSLQKVTTLYSQI